MHGAGEPHARNLILAELNIFLKTHAAILVSRKQISLFFFLNLPQELSNKLVCKRSLFFKGEKNR